MGYGRPIIGPYEKQSGKTEVGRVLLYGLLLFCLGVVGALAVTTEAILVGRWFGPLVLCALTVYAMDSVKFSKRWPFVSFVFSDRAHKNKAVVAAVGAAGIAFTVMWMFNQWPRVISWLWWDGSLWYGTNVGKTCKIPLVSGYDLWCTAPAWLLWTRLVLIVVIPLTVPDALRLVRYRFRLETVAPTAAQSFRSTPGRVGNVAGVIEFDYPDKASDEAPSPRPNAGGEL